MAFYMHITKQSKMTTLEYLVLSPVTIPSCFKTDADDISMLKIRGITNMIFGHDKMSILGTCLIVTEAQFAAQPARW